MNHGGASQRNLVLILLTAFAIRLVGVGFGLPFLYHADEPIVVNHAMAYGTFDFNPHFFKIPPLTSYLLFVVYGLYFLVGRFSGRFSGLHDFETLFYADPSSFYLIGRLIFGVFLGTLTVYFFYRLIARFFSLAVAELSAFFLAVCFLHVRDSHYLYADIPLLLIMILAFFPLLAILEKKDKPANHVAAGILIGLATAFKYNGIALLGPYLWIAFDQKKRKALKNLLLCATAANAVFFIFNPYFFFDFKFALQELQAEAHAHGGVPWLHHLTYSLVGGVGPFMLAAALARISEGVGGRDKKASVFLLFIAAYYALITTAGQPYDRYALPLLPFILYFAADFFVSFHQKRPASKLLLLVLLFMAMFPMIAKSLLFDAVMLAPDTRTQAKAWVEANIPSGSKLALGGDFFMPRLSFSVEQLEDKKGELSSGSFSAAQKRRLDYLLSVKKEPSYNLYFLMNNADPAGRFLFAKPVLDYDLQAVEQAGIDYVLLNRHEGHDGGEEFRNAIEGDYQLVAEFNPYRKTLPDLLDRQVLTGGPFLFEDLLQRKSNGPIILVYKRKTV